MTKPFTRRATLKAIDAAIVNAIRSGLYTSCEIEAMHTVAEAAHGCKLHISGCAVYELRETYTLVAVMPKEDK